MTTVERLRDVDELRRAAEQFGSSLNDDLERRDRDAVFDRSLWSRCAEYGVLGLPVPEPYGGSELDLPAVVEVLDGLGYGCRDNGLLFALGAQVWSVELPILQFGTDEQRERYLPRLVDGSIMGAHCVTESEAGSDAFSLATTARADGDGWVLDGVKTFITGAAHADVFLVLATLDPAMGAQGLTAFLVDREVEGIATGQTFEKMGIRTSALGEVVLTGCRVPASALLGKLGGGSAVFGAAMEWERSYILAPALGTMRRQLDQCRRFARTRRQFGAPIGKQPAVAAKLVDMQLRLNTSRLLMRRTAERKQEGHRLTYEPSEVKLHVSESWVQSSADALQIHGATGYLVESGLERDLRDAYASRIYSGTSEIQRMIIAGLLGL